MAKQEPTLLTTNRLLAAGFDTARKREFRKGSCAGRTRFSPTYLGALGNTCRGGPILLLEGGFMLGAYGPKNFFLLSQEEDGHLSAIARSPQFAIKEPVAVGLLDTQPASAAVWDPQRPRMVEIFQDFLENDQGFHFPDSGMTAHLESPAWATPIPSATTCGTGAINSLNGFPTQG